MSGDMNTGGISGINKISHSRHLEASEGKESPGSTDKGDEIKIDTREVTLLSDEMAEENKNKPIKPHNREIFQGPDLPTLYEMALADAMAAAATGLVQDLGKDNVRESHKEEPPGNEENKIGIPMNPSNETEHQTAKRENKKVPNVLTVDDSLNGALPSKEERNNES